MTLWASESDREDFKDTAIELACQRNALREALRGLVKHSRDVRDLAIEDYDSPEFLELIAAGERALLTVGEAR